MEEAEAFENMYQYIANLSPEDKVSDEEYEQRLMICRQCSHLLSGMCGKCGCYVETVSYTHLTLPTTPYV